jgi:acetylornithine deacetylase
MVDIPTLLRDLVMRPSVNPMGRAIQGPELLEQRVTDYLESFFRSLNVPYQRQPIAPERANILAVYEPPGATSTLLLEAHQDTVPVEGMTIEPFGGRIADGRLYGRGACDVKGGMTAMLAAFARLVRERPVGACRVVMACTVDEEHTFLGVQQLARTPLDGGKGGPVRAVVAEPTRLHIVNAHKGVVRWHVETRGRACHSSTPDQGLNAIYRMGELLIAIEDFARRLQAGRVDPLLGPATLSVGRIEGGSSVNTVPDYCRIEIDRRVIPGEDPSQAPAELQRFLEERGVWQPTFTSSAPWFYAPALAPQGSQELVQRLGSAIDAVAGKHQVQAVAYCTDASTLAATGIPCVVFGPGDIAKAHTCDESIPLAEVEQASEVLYRLACAQ